MVSQSAGQPRADSGRSPGAQPSTEHYRSPHQLDRAAFLGNVAFGVGNPIGSGYDYLTVCSPTATCVPGLNMPSPPATPSYTIVASPVPGQSQVNDLQCHLFAVDSAGQEYAVDSAGNGQTKYCWAN